MKLKVLFLSTAILTVATFFTYCTKETPAEQVIHTQQEEASSRALCDVTIQAVGGCLNICGTQTSPTVCSTIGGVFLTGNGTIPIGGVQTYTINTPASLLISRGNCVSQQVVTAIVSTPVSGPKVYNVPPLGTVQVNVDNLCQL